MHTSLKVFTHFMTIYFWQMNNIMKILKRQHDTADLENDTYYMCNLLGTKGLVTVLTTP